jgi:hypothetical protein
MVKCRAIRDGLVKTTYIYAGEEFYIDKCPRWAVVVNKKNDPKAKAEDEDEAGKASEEAGA